AVKAGKVVYVGQSAGSVAMGWTLSGSRAALVAGSSNAVLPGIWPMSVDPSWISLLEKGASSEDDQNSGSATHRRRSLHFQFPGLGEYVGMPYRLVPRPHVTFNVKNCCYESYCHGLEKADKVFSQGSSNLKHDVFAAILVDYDAGACQSDTLEVSGGQVRFHVGFCDKVDNLSQAVLEGFRKLPFSWTYEHPTMRRQPAGNSSQGWFFAWTLEDGEVIAAGPASTFRPFWPYSSCFGPLPDAPPVEVE
ncbi:unnamed protein product, partial [Polarella glacialis]